ncbi:hypothetical protein ACU8KH_02029 [Lachancea thermotolerans]
MIEQKQSWNYWLNDYMLIRFCTTSDSISKALVLLSFACSLPCKNGFDGHHEVFFGVTGVLQNFVMM